MTGLLFDFNGTLFRDSDKHESAWRQFILQKTGKHVTQTDFDQHFHGQNAKNVLEWIFQQKLTTTEVDDYAEEKEVIYRQLCLADPASFHLIEGAETFLNAAQEKGIPVNIATASGANNLAFFYQHFQLDRRFPQEKVVYDDGNLLGKPAPMPYLKAAAAIGLPSTDCIVFEDAVAGFRSGRNAEAKQVVAITTGDNREKLLVDPHVDLVIDDYYDHRLLPLLDQT